MAKRLREHVKYTVKELDEYTKTDGSCVRKVNTDLHLSVGPFSLADIKHIVVAHVIRSRVGQYDVHLDGIVLDVKNVKILGTTAAIRADDPRLHMNVNADVYLFAPTEGAELSGIVKHIGAHHVGVVLYRVFNVNLRVSHAVNKELVQMEQSVKFRIRNYNLQNIFPYIEGELLLESTVEAMQEKKTKLVFMDNDNVDSGIEEKEGIQELDGLLALIKNEQGDHCDRASTSLPKTPKKRSKKHSESSDSATSSKKSKKKTTPEYSELLSHIKSEKIDEPEIVSTLENTPQLFKKVLESSEPKEAPTPTKKTKKKHTKSGENMNNSESTIPLTPKKIKKELAFSGDEQTHAKSKKSKKDKKSKARPPSPIPDVYIKLELESEVD